MALHELLHQSRTMGEIHSCDNHIAGILDPTVSSSAQDQSRTNYLITMIFSCEPVLHESVLGHDLECGVEVNLPETELSLRLYLNPDSDVDRELPSRQPLLSHMISRWLNLSEDSASGLSEFAFQQAMETLGSALPGSNTFELRFRLFLVHSHVVVARTFEERLMLLHQMIDQESDGMSRMYAEDQMLLHQVMEQSDGPQMVPATEESIKNLKRERVEDDCDDVCVICLERFAKGCETVPMPCAHSFHRDCIEEWLNRSHYCPICRFKMPVEE